MEKKTGDKTETSAVLVKNVYKALGRGSVLNHQPTETNKLGQSSVSNFIEDILDIVINAKNEREACAALSRFLHNGEYVIGANPSEVPYNE